ncbi:MAG: hypothetical protein R2699_16285 [Acidimicrobiales bacterium]
MAALQAWLASFVKDCYGRYGVVIRAWMENRVTGREAGPGWAGAPSRPSPRRWSPASTRPAPSGSQAELDAARCWR